MPTPTPAPHAASAAIEAVALRKAFGRTTVLDGLNLRVLAGGSTAIIGPSGSGKSTLMALFGALTCFDSGSLTVLGIPIDAKPRARSVLELRRRAAWLPQLPIVLPGRTCLDNALAGVRARRDVEPRDLARAAELFEELGVAQLRDREVSVLSGGELQKLALIRALLVGPELILADEPTASLDEVSTAAVADALVRVARHATVVVASHDPMISERCARVVRLSAGRVVEVRA